MEEIKAEFTQLNNDMYWRKTLSINGEFISMRWIGYDDKYWWDNVAPTDEFQVKHGYRLNPETNTITRLAGPIE